MAGRAGGKNKLAEFVSDFCGHEIVAFADPLKDLVAKFLGKSNVDKKTDRPLLVELAQYLKGEGTITVVNKKMLDTFLLRNDIDPGQDSCLDFWTKQLSKRLKNGNKYVISDLRFKIEHEMVQKYGGILVKINCDKQLCEKRLSLRDGGFDPEIWEKVSENSFQTLEPDLIVENVGKDIEMYIDFISGYDALKEETYG